MSLRRVAATRFVGSMMEGGSRPALVKADDGQLYVVKLRGAAQGVAPLAAEILVGELARRLGLRVPEIVLVDIASIFLTASRTKSCVNCFNGQPAPMLA